jgi:acetyltransferase
MEFQLSTLTPESAECCLPELAALLMDAVASGGSVGWVEVPSEQEAAGYWRGVIASLGPGRLLFAASLGGRPLGTVQLVLESRPNGLHRAEVSKLLVHREARRQGLGEALMRRVEEEARVRGRTLLLLDTLQGSAAERLYARLGWQSVGVVPGYARVTSGALEATHIMMKQLG